MMRFARQHTTRRPFRSAPGRENAHRQVEYAVVKATLANRTDKAVLLSREDLVAAVWVPNFRMEISSRIAAARSVLKTEVSLSIELPFALENKLV